MMDASEIQKKEKPVSEPKAKGPEPETKSEAEAKIEKEEAKPAPKSESSSETEAESEEAKSVTEARKPKSEAKTEEPEAKPKIEEPEVAPEPEAKIEEPEAKTEPKPEKEEAKSEEETEAKEPKPEAKTEEPEAKPKIEEPEVAPEPEKKTKKEEAKAEEAKAEEAEASPEAKPAPKPESSEAEARKPKVQKATKEKFKVSTLAKKAKAGKLDKAKARISVLERKVNEQTRQITEESSRLKRLVLEKKEKTLAKAFALGEKAEASARQIAEASEKTTKLAQQTLELLELLQQLRIAEYRCNEEQLKLRVSQLALEELQLQTEIRKEQKEQEEQNKIRLTRVKYELRQARHDENEAINTISYLILLLNPTRIAMVNAGEKLSIFDDLPVAQDIVEEQTGAKTESHASEGQEKPAANEKDLQYIKDTTKKISALVLKLKSARKKSEKSWNLMTIVALNVVEMLPERVLKVRSVGIEEEEEEEAAEEKREDTSEEMANAKARLRNMQARLTDAKAKVRDVESQMRRIVQQIREAQELPNTEPISTGSRSNCSIAALEERTTEFKNRALGLQKKQEEIAQATKDAAKKTKRTLEELQIREIKKQKPELEFELENLIEKETAKTRSATKKAARADEERRGAEAAKADEERRIAEAEDVERKRNGKRLLVFTILAAVVAMLGFGCGFMGIFGADSIPIVGPFLAQAVAAGFPVYGFMFMGAGFVALLALALEKINATLNQYGCFAAIIGSCVSQRINTNTSRRSDIVRAEQNRGRGREVV